jgi:hypothetical protein
LGFGRLSVWRFGVLNGFRRLPRVAFPWRIRLKHARQLVFFLLDLSIS